jgi:hypothetical protein
VSQTSAGRSYGRVPSNKSLEATREEQTAESLLLQPRRSTQPLSVMRPIGNRAALIGAYLVTLVYISWPALEHPAQLSNPTRQFLVIAFVVATLVALTVDKWEIFTMVIAGLNGLVGLGVLGAILWTVRGKTLGGEESFELPAIVYFSIVVPLIAAVTLFFGARTLGRHGPS